MATPGFFKIKSFSWNKGIPVHEVTRKIFAFYSNYILDVVNLPKQFGNSSISMREVIKTSIL